MRKKFVLLIILGCYCCLTMLAQPDRKNIEPLLQTAWGQGSPYNLLCPVKNGKHCQTGCVATAMAQIMHYHQWPAEGYDWDNMQLTYKGGETEEQQLAVAKLIHDCGVAVNMDYGIYSSAAWEGDAAVALVRDFGYAESVQEIFAVFYDSREEWENTIYNELAAGRPVFYGGMPAGYLHQFVCDGYKDGKFHFNMSWPYKADGWYTFDEISIFPDSHSAIIGVQKAGETDINAFTPALFEENKGVCYDLNGMRRNTPHQGLNIIQTSSGVVKASFK